MTRIQWSALFLAGVFLQRLFLDHLLSIQDITPDIVLVLLIFYAMRYGRIDGVVAGFLVGVLLDVLDIGVFGLSALAKCVTGFIFGSFTLKQVRKHAWGFPLLLGVTALAHDAMMHYIARIFIEDIPALTLLWRYSVPTTLYTIVVGEMAFLLCSRRRTLSL